MLDSLQTVVAVIVALGLLVTVHEWGHFIVARMCGVKVLRFSIGFGKSFYSWYDKKGTEFSLALIPLGGYVKMVDEREGEVAEEELDFAFNRKPAIQRIAIVAAGPLVNLIFAVAIYWAIFLGGQQVLAPIVGSTVESSIAEQAGLNLNDELLSIDGESINSWDDAVQRLVLKVLEPGEIKLQIKEGVSGRLEERVLRLEQALVIDENTDPLQALGLEPKIAKVPAVIGDVVKDHAAEKAGLQAGDKVTKANGVVIEDWQAWVKVIQVNPNQNIELELLRDKQLITINVVPGSKKGANNKELGFVGAGAAPFEWPEELVRDIKYSPLEALLYSVNKTWDNSVLILVSTWKLAKGDLARDNLGGPIMIAQLAGRYASYGIEPYLLFIAYISIVLGIMNLLPIPVLDGGHIVFYTIELITRRPVPEVIQNIGMRIGLVLLFTLMAFAIFNDIQRLIAGS